MANSNRIYTNDGGQMFLPMNVDGGSGNAAFWTTGKTMGFSFLVILNFFYFTWLSTLYGGPLLYIVMGAIGILFDIKFIRKFIIEEKYYLKMFEKQQQFEIAEPSVFWNVNIQNKNILYYLDGKMGVVVKMERDTIVGKDDEFREKHYDAWSEFYKELNFNNLKRVQMNLMDTAGNDPRFKELDKLVIGAKFNDNLKELVERQIGHIKSKARNTLFEDDYFLIYTDNYIPHEELLQKVHACVGKLMKGAFINYHILDRAGLNELFKNEFKIKYFNEDNASISLYGNISKNVVAFKIKSVTINDEELPIGTVEEKRLKELAKKLHLHKIPFGSVDTYSLVASKPKDTSSGDMELKQRKEQKQEEEKQNNFDDILYTDDDTNIDTLDIDDTLEVEIDDTNDTEVETEIENDDTNDTEAGKQTTDNTSSKGNEEIVWDDSDDDNEILDL